MIGLIVEECIEGKNYGGRPCLDYKWRIMIDQGCNSCKKRKKFGERKVTRKRGALLQTNLRVDYAQQKMYNDVIDNKTFFLLWPIRIRTPYVSTITGKYLNLGNK